MWGHNGPIVMRVVAICSIYDGKVIPIPPSTPGVEAFFVIQVRRRVGAFISYFISDGVGYFKAYKISGNNPYIIGDRYYPDLNEVAFVKEIISRWMDEIVSQ